MLRASADKNNETINLFGVGNETIDSGVPHATALSALAEAAVLRDEHEMPIARDHAVEELGVAATVRAVAVAANFEMMNRLLDAVGIGPTGARRAIGELIGVPLPPRFA
jgi:hypothetical protein